MLSLKNALAFIRSSAYNSLHLRINYRQLNQVTVITWYALLRIDDLFGYLRIIKVISEIDLRYGYHQKCVKDVDILGHSWTP